jgi:hypothetical protein
MLVKTKKGKIFPTELGKCTVQKEEGAFSSTILIQNER